MDGSRFDSLIRSLAGTRRSLVSGALALAVGWLSVFSTGAKRKKKRKKRKPKAKPNEFGCFEVGDPCKSQADCCSGVCEGKKGKKQCRAHDTGNCKQDGPELCVIDPPVALTCNDDATCRCFGTTAGSIVCARYDAEGCADCQRDVDCLALGYPPESVCVPMSIGPCAGACAGRTACLIPCDVELPTPTG